MGQDQKLGEFKSMIWANEPQQTIKQVDITGGLYIGKMRETFNSSRDQMRDEDLNYELGDTNGYKEMEKKKINRRDIKAGWRKRE